jgi:hypothetical protein
MAVAPGHEHLAAIIIWNRDKFQAKVLVLYSVLSLGNKTSLYCRTGISYYFLYNLVIVTEYLIEEYSPFNDRFITITNSVK